MGYVLGHDLDSSPQIIPRTETSINDSVSAPLRHHPGHAAEIRSRHLDTWQPAAMRDFAFESQGDVLLGAVVRNYLLHNPRGKVAQRGPDRFAVFVNVPTA